MQVRIPHIVGERGKFPLFRARENGGRPVLIMPTGPYDPETVRKGDHYLLNGDELQVDVHFLDEDRSSGTYIMANRPILSMLNGMVGDGSFLAGRLVRKAFDNGSLVFTLEPIERTDLF